nr:uncharacterized protein CI109_003902 [Kwoniella shandongensis]KAA5527643.1 hypothetical protein CI109_003902 [Kwoniella shandongensis]
MESQWSPPHPKKCDHPLVDETGIEHNPSDDPDSQTSGASSPASYVPHRLSPVPEFREENRMNNVHDNLDVAAQLPSQRSFLNSDSDKSASSLATIDPREASAFYHSDAHSPPPEPDCLSDNGQMSRCTSATSNPSTFGLDQNGVSIEQDKLVVGHEVEDLEYSSPPSEASFSNDGKSVRMLQPVRNGMVGWLNNMPSMPFMSETTSTLPSPRGSVCEESGLIPGQMVGNLGYLPAAPTSVIEARPHSASTWEPGPMSPGRPTQTLSRCEGRTTMLPSPSVSLHKDQEPDQPLAQSPEQRTDLFVNATVPPIHPIQPSETETFGNELTCAIEAVFNKDNSPEETSVSHTTSTRSLCDGTQHHNYSRPIHSVAPPPTQYNWIRNPHPDFTSTAAEATYRTGDRDGRPGLTEGPWLDSHEDTQQSPSHRVAPKFKSRLGGRTFSSCADRVRTFVRSLHQSTNLSPDRLTNPGEDGWTVGHAQKAVKAQPSLINIQSGRGQPSVGQKNKIYQDLVPESEGYTTLSAPSSSIFNSDTPPRLNSPFSNPTIVSNIRKTRSTFPIGPTLNTPKGMRDFTNQLMEGNRKRTRFEKEFENRKASENERLKAILLGND